MPYFNQGMGKEAARLDIFGYRQHTGRETADTIANGILYQRKTSGECLLNLSSAGVCVCVCVFAGPLKNICIYACVIVYMRSSVRMKQYAGWPL